MIEEDGWSVSIVVSVEIEQRFLLSVIPDHSAGLLPFDPSRIFFFLWKSLCIVD
jgi:hypothetical protein